MTDEIKAIKERLMFRVWDEHKKSYRDDYDIQKDGQVTLRNMFNGFDITKHPDSFTIEQCTGIRDKNGKLVFLGDVLSENGKLLEVCWSPSIASYMLDDYMYNEAGEYEGYGNLYTIHDTEIAEMEVIGNIHEMEDYK